MYLKSLALTALFFEMGLASLPPHSFPTGPFPPATTTSYDIPAAEANGFIFPPTTCTTCTSHTTHHPHHSSSSSDSCTSSSESECSSSESECSSSESCWTSSSDSCTSEEECCCPCPEPKCEEKIIVIPCPTCPSKVITTTVTSAAVLPTSAAVLPTSAAVLPTQQVLPVCTPCTNYVTVTTTPAMACTTMVFCDLANQSPNCVAQNNQQIEKIVSDALRSGGQVFINGQLVVFSTASGSGSGSGSSGSGGNVVVGGSTLVTVTGQQANTAVSEVASWGSSILAMVGAVAFYLFAL